MPGLGISTWMPVPKSAGFSPENVLPRTIGSLTSAVRITDGRAT